MGMGIEMPSPRQPWQLYVVYLTESRHVSDGRCSSNAQAQSHSCDLNDKLFLREHCDVERNRSVRT